MIRVEKNYFYLEKNFVQFNTLEKLRYMEKSSVKICKWPPTSHFLPQPKNIFYLLLQVKKFKHSIA